jgi:glucoside 3-dehydrogenase (cytochrome c) hitch-hiker subunit
MKRREVLKGMGLSLGYAIATPSLLSLLQSCNTDKVIWTPKFVSPSVGSVLEELIDLILPKTDNSPGALEVNVPEFIDLYFGKAMDDERQHEFSVGLQAIMDELQISEDVNPVSRIKTEAYDKLLSKYLRTNKEAQKKLKKEDNLVFGALVDLRNTSVWAYRTSEKVGEEVLAYDPIPGAQLGCIPLEEATGGKRWSL